MKILHYLFGIPPVKTGGVPRYALDLMQEQVRLGHEVSLLIPGIILKTKKEKVKIKSWKKEKGIQIYRIINPNYVANAFGIDHPLEFMRKVPMDVYIKWLKDVDVDIVHVHSILGIHLEFLQAAKQLNIPILYTVHDFFGVCPKINLLKDGMNCTETNWDSCYACCQDAFSLARLRFGQTAVSRFCLQSSFLLKIIQNEHVNSLVQGFFKMMRSRQEGGVQVNNISKTVEYDQLKEYYKKIFKQIDLFHYNSRQTKRIFEERAGEKPSKILPVSHSGISDRRIKRAAGDIIRLGYLGSPTPYKGYDFLLHELDCLYDTGRIGFQLNTYIDTDVQKRPYINNHGTFVWEKQTEVYESMDLLIVPSMCYETFGLVVLEALSYGVPVIISENVGASMLLEDYPQIGRMFPLTSGGLETVLEEIYDNRKLISDMNIAILKSDINFDFTIHARKILEMYHYLGQDKDENII